MAVKSTFVLDDATVRTIRKLAARARQPQSYVVREAVAHYAAREEKSTPEERERWLETFDDLTARVAPRAARDVEKELADLRRSRRAGWTRATDT